MMGKSLAVLAAAAFGLVATMAYAAGPGAGGVGGIGGIGSLGSIGPMAPMAPISSIGANIPPGLVNGSKRSSGGTMSTLPFLPFPTNDPNHYHEIKLIGRLAKDQSGLTIDQQIVRMRVDGRSIPMSINGDEISSTLQFDQGDELGQVLYRLILSKELNVVGDPKLRNQIAKDAAASPPRQVLVDGFVYDRTTPYLVLVSVEDAP